MQKDYLGCLYVGQLYSFSYQKYGICDSVSLTVSSSLACQELKAFAGKSCRGQMNLAISEKIIYEEKLMT